MTDHLSAATDTADADRLNAIMATGALFAALYHAGDNCSDVELVSVDGLATPAITCRFPFPFLRSQYRIDVSIVPGTDEETL